MPPSLLKKAEEVRIEDGPTKIEASIEDVQRLAHHDVTILDEVCLLFFTLASGFELAQALDILDNEASEDEAARKELSLTRLPSHEANVELIDKSVRYRSVLTQAAESDESVRQKWDEWEDSIRELTLDEVWTLPSILLFAEISFFRPSSKPPFPHRRCLRPPTSPLKAKRREPTPESCASSWKS